MTFFLIISIHADDGNGEQGHPTNPQEKKMVERVSAYIVKVLADQPSQNKRYVVTGLAISSDSVLTSALISRYGNERITVVTVSGDTYETELQGLDQNSSLALLKLKSGSMDYAKSTAKVSIGDPVWVMGAFYQNFPSLFKGVVSSADERQIIINAPAIPGVSGGAVITANGALAGIVRGRLGVAWNRDLRIRSEETELLFSGENPIGQPLLFALPISGAKRIAADLAEFGYLRQGWVGVWCSYDEPGVIHVTDVTAESPAENAGIKPGDEILSIDNKSIGNIIDLQRLIFDKKPGDRLGFQIKRSGMVKDVLVEVGENPQARQSVLNRNIPRLPDVENRPWPFLASPSPDSSFSLMRFKTVQDLGLVGTLIGKEVAQQHGIKEGHGILLQEVLSESPFRALNLMAGDVVVEVDGRPIRSTKDLEVLARSFDTVRFDQKGSKKTMVRYYRDRKPLSSSIQLQAEPLRTDEIRQLRNRMEQVSSLLRDQEFRNLNDTLQGLKDRIKTDNTGFDGSLELMKMEKRIEQYYKKSKEQIDAEYKFLQEMIKQMKKEMDKDS